MYTTYQYRYVCLPSAYTPRDSHIRDPAGYPYNYAGNRHCRLRMCLENGPMKDSKFVHGLKVNAKLPQLIVINSLLSMLLLCYHTSYDCLLIHF